jgi:AcrR family transcriptional regulator
MRRRDPDRLDQLISASLRVFGEKGYRRTQMADVAREMGVSAGTLYNYVSGKEGLFYLMIDRALLESPAGEPPKFPVPTPAPGAIVTRLRERLSADAALPSLQAALARLRVPDPRQELEGIVGDLYRLIDRTWPCIVVLERSALELPQLARVFYIERRGLVRRLEQYLRTRIREGQLRPVPHPGGTARLLLEVVAEFALHRHHDPDPEPLDDATARSTVVDLLVNALVPAGGGPGGEERSPVDAH